MPTIAAPLHLWAAIYPSARQQKFACCALHCPCAGQISPADSIFVPECAGCGRCCHQVVGLIAGVDVVPESMVVVHDGERCMEQRGDGACVALDAVTKLCTIYATRPQVCRDFERGSELCRGVLVRAAVRAAVRGACSTR